MNKKLPSDTFCVLPFMHIAINSGGGYRLCCNSSPKNNKIIRDGSETDSYRIYKDSVHEVWNSKHYRDIRKQFINGERPATCERCFREEDAGIRSPRFGYNEKWFNDSITVTEDPPLDVRYVDLRLGNLCNLKCRMCNPWSSSMWVKDWDKIVTTTDLFPGEPPLAQKDFDWLDQMTSWPDRAGTGENFIAMADTIEEIYLTGGEPTLAASQYALFDYCIDRKISKNIRLKYNTNLTNVPAKMLEYWKHFKSVQLNASIDAAGERDRYIRYPSSWEKIEENFRKLKDLPNVNIQVHCTVQVLNMCALPELFDWIRSQGIDDSQIYLNILNHPERWNIRTLPVELKKLAEDRLADYHDIPKVTDAITYMWTEDWHSKYWEEFKAFNGKTDELQNMSLLEVCPEFQGYV